MYNSLPKLFLKKGERFLYFFPSPQSPFPPSKLANKALVKGDACVMQWGLFPHKGKILALKCSII